MRVLIINDLYECGGAEIMARLQKKILLEKGHDVLLLTLDPMEKEHASKENAHVSVGRKYNFIQSLLYRYIRDNRVFTKIKNIINDFKPDIIHLHNVYLSSKAVYLAVRNIPCVQTVHDYSITCIKSTSIYPDGKLCNGYCHNNCIQECFSGSLKERISFLGRMLAMRINNKLRYECVDTFISPSTFLKDICIENGFNTVTISNPAEFDDECLINDEAKQDFRIKRFLYFGAVNRVKGLKPLIEAFKVFAANKSDVELLIAGPVKSDFEDEFITLTEGNKKIKYIGKIPHDEIKALLRKVYVVVIPSLWIENYPGTLLEAVACKCLVIATNRGGMPEMLGNKELLFDVLSQNSIIDKLNYVSDLDMNAYKKITDELYKKYVIDYSLEKYGHQLLEEYKKILEKTRG